MQDAPSPSLQQPALHIHDRARGLRKLGQTIPIHAIIHKRAASLGNHEPNSAQHLQMVRDRGLPDRKMLHDVADAHRRAARRQQIQNPYARRIGQRLEPSRILARNRALQLRRRGHAAARRHAASPRPLLRASHCVLALLRHANIVYHSSINVDVYLGCRRPRRPLPNCRSLLCSLKPTNCRTSRPMR